MGIYYNIYYDRVLLLSLSVGIISNENVHTTKVVIIITIIK